MKNLFFLLLIPFFFMGCNAQTEAKDGIHRIEIGETLPMMDVEMMDISGKNITLKEAMGENGLLLNFSCNTCPFVIAWEDRYPDIEKMAKENKIGLVLVNSNEKKRTAKNMDDSLEAMQAHAKEVNYDCHYVVDKNHKLADAIGAFKTPHVFLFDKDGKLVYKGAIDDHWKSKEGVKEQYLANAVNGLVNGTKIEPAVTKGKGCSIKRLDK